MYSDSYAPTISPSVRRSSIGVNRNGTAAPHARVIIGRTCSLLLLSLLLAVLASGCVQLVLEYKVSADRSVEATYKIGLQSSLYALAASGGEDPLSELRESTVAKGFVLSQYRERDHSGIVARRRFAGFAESSSRSRSWAGVLGRVA